MKPFRLPPLLLAAVALSAAAATEPVVKPTLNVRLRHEDAAQTGLRDSAALTLRTRLGLLATFEQGFTFSIEAENITAADGNAYNQAGLNSAGAGRTVVADPETTELNQAWAGWNHRDTTITLGRQRLVLDSARFVGDVGWRQNMQTFDAVSLQNKSLDHTTVHYAWLRRANRVFGRDHPQGRWDSDSHLLNIRHQNLIGYAYLLDFEGPAAGNSCATYGASYEGTRVVSEKAKLLYRAEYATQRDFGASPLRYSADYYALEIGISGSPGLLALGHETLGAGSGGSFRMPLATLHAFNGWADVFLTTPANGLRDTYLKVSAKLPAQINLLGFYHQFTASRSGADYGDEFDLQLSRRLSDHLSALVKTAYFAGSLTTPDVRKLWLQLEYTL